uniref:Uncharacterized protein n=1 Tax=Caenorhabditis japonica TaxID=281687 RepID=A0A8R1ETS1_CAEJA
MPFLGFGRGQTNAPYHCPVMNCPRSTHDSVESSNYHWIKNHEDKKQKLTYLCPECPDSGFSKWRYFCRHLLRRHPIPNVSFQFKFTSKNQHGNNE